MFTLNLVHRQGHRPKGQQPLPPTYRRPTEKGKFGLGEPGLISKNYGYRRAKLSMKHPTRWIGRMNTDHALLYLVYLPCMLKFYLHTYLLTVKVP